MESLWDLSSVANGNVRISIKGKAVNAREFIGSLGQSSRISQISDISTKMDKKAALRKARNQVIVAALMGEDRLYRRTE